MSATIAATRSPGFVLSDRSDESLIELARAGDERAVHELLGRYRGFARHKAGAYFVVGGDRDDVIQEGMIGLYKAIRDYEPGRGASLRSFADLCITRQILTAVRSARRQKHIPLNTAVRFQPRGARDGSAATDVPAERSGCDPLQRLVADHDLRCLRELCERVLSELECRALQLYVEGRSYQEIAEQLGRDAKCVDNAVQRIRRKLEAHLAVC